VGTPKADEGKATPTGDGPKLAAGFKFGGAARISDVSSSSGALDASGSAKGAPGDATTAADGGSGGANREAPNATKEQTSSASPTAPLPSSSSSGGSSLWGKKAATGAWTCSVCFVENGADQSQCLACGDPKPGTKDDSKPATKPLFGAVGKSKADDGALKPKVSFGTATKRDAAGDGAAKPAVSFGTKEGASKAPLSFGTGKPSPFGASAQKKPAVTSDTNDEHDATAVSAPAKPSFGLSAGSKPFVPGLHPCPCSHFSLIISPLHHPFTLPHPLHDS
jgi:hypothetical protein